MSQNDKNIMDQLDTLYPDVACMNVEVVFKRMDQTESYITDTWSLLEQGHHDILKMMQKVEQTRKTSQDGAYRVLTRNETKLGKMYHCDAVSKLDYKPNYEYVLEVQWG